MVQPKDSDKSLHMIVDESMIEFRIRFLQCLCDDAVPRKKSEVDAGRLAKCGRVNAKTSNITNDEAQEVPCRNVEASKNILCVRLKRNSVVNQGGKECFTCDAEITTEMLSEAWRTVGSLLIQEGHTFLLCIERAGVFDSRNPRRYPSVIHL